MGAGPRDRERAKGLSRDDRAVLDTRVAATVGAYQGADAFDPDQLVWALDVAATELTDRRTVERRAAPGRRRHRHERLGRRRRHPSR